MIDDLRCFGKPRDALDNQLDLEQLESALPEDLELLQQSLACSYTELAAQRGTTRSAEGWQVTNAKSLLRVVGGSMARVVAA